MYLGRVIGRVVATIKYSGLEGCRIKLVEPIDDGGEVCGRPHAAIDVTQSREGDMVFLVGSREAALALPNTFVPVDAAIVGLVDELDIQVDPECVSLA